MSVKPRHRTFRANALCCLAVPSCGRLIRARTRFNRSAGRDSGSVLIIALLVLMLLALLGVSAGTTASIEIRVAGNERVYRQNLYRAEGAAVVGAQLLENNQDIVALRESAFPNMSYAELPDPDPFSDANWVPPLSAAAIDDQSRYTMVHTERLAGGASLDMEESRLHQFDVYGRSDHNRGTGIVQIGWWKRY
jgi:hypothetical protein